MVHNSLFPDAPAVERLFHAGTYRLRHAAYRALFLRKVLGAGRWLNYAQLRNSLPNTGPVPVARSFHSVREINASHPVFERRSEGVDSFEGFALDDGVFDCATERTQLWSNVKLAAFLARFGHAHSRHPSVLELGCGPAHLFYYLRRYGVPDYVGIDGNPYFVQFNPLLKGFEDHFLHLNLQQEVRLCAGPDPLHFDLLCSFEVLEHIREDAIDAFLRTACHHMHPRSVFFCTASLKDGLDVHVLVRDRGWWLERFAQAGLVPASDEAHLLTELAWRHPWNWDTAISNLFALQLRNGSR